MSDSEGDENDVRDEDTVKILLATDCHLGYESSTKKLQDNDSLITFEEILKHGLNEEVDFILLGGDLFHDSKPCQTVVKQCVELLTKYTLGDGNITIQFLSNPEVIFSHTSQKMVNYENPNLNVAMPIFSIHGNHDNPSFESTGSMDLLGALGLINYFGKWSNLTNVTIPPLVFKKGETYVSLYGLSYMNDQRLSRLLRDQKVNLLRPSGIPEPFNIFVLHQNRAKHTENGYIPENKLPDFLDLIFWGHEHECRVKEEEIIVESDGSQGSYHITQPGSSVATSLCEGEAKEKHIGLLKVNKNRFNIRPIKLETVRPFVFDNIHLQSIKLQKDFTKSLSDFVFEYVDSYIENELLPRAELQITGHPQQPTRPLIRLRIFYTLDVQLFDSMKISRKYCDRVANPRDMLLFRKERSAAEGGKMKHSINESDANNEDISEFFGRDAEPDWNKTVQGSIRTFFEREDQKNPLTVLSVDGLNEALRRFVEAGDDDAFEDVINHQSKKSMEYMKKYDVDEENEIIEHLKLYKEERSKTEGTEDDKRDVQQLLDNSSRNSRKKGPQRKEMISPLDSDHSGDEAIKDEDELSTIRGRGTGSRGRGRAAGLTSTRARGTRGKGRAAKTTLDVSVSSKGHSSKPNVFEKIFDGASRNSKNITTNEKAPIYVPDSDSD